MVIDVLTLFPKMFDSILGESILKRAQVKNLVRIEVHNLRDWTSDAHRTADDKPFGGGPGMVMKLEPVYRALEDLGAIKGGKRIAGNGLRVILLTPQGKTFDQNIAKHLVREKRLVLICGHYEGVDDRIRSLADIEISVGDYILTCGEIPAMVIIDAVTRLVPGVLGHEDSVKSESFESGLLEYPQYTRPADFNGMKVPDVLLSGDHKNIETWRHDQAIERTRERRPDLFKKVYGAKKRNNKKR